MNSYFIHTRLKRLFLSLSSLLSLCVCVLCLCEEKLHSARRDGEAGGDGEGQREWRWNDEVCEFLRRCM